MKVSPYGLALLSAIFLVGCTELAPRYSVSGSNVATIRSKLNSPISLGGFSSSLPRNNGVQCGAFKVSPPDQQTFSGYITSALISELRVADRYSESSMDKLSGVLDEITLDASPFSFTGHWSFSATITIGKMNKKVTSVYEYRYAATSTACQGAAANLTSAIQDLVGQIVSTI